MQSSAPEYVIGKRQLALPATEQFPVMSRILKDAGMSVERFAQPADDIDEKRPQGKLSPLMTSASTEYLTPSWILDLVEKVGPIDLDPCGHPMAEATKRARAVSFILNIAALSRPEKSERWINCDGLTQDWVRYVLSAERDRRRGLAFINPPYGRALKAWAEKCDTSQCSQIVLVPSRTDTTWWARLNPIAWCAVKGRLHFHGPDGQPIKDAAPFPSAVCLLHPEGDQLAHFVEVFSTVGIVYRRA